MCDPISITAGLTAAVGLAGAVVSHAGQTKAYNQNVTAANVNYAARTEAAGAEQTQAIAQTSEDQLSSMIRQAKEAGRISAAASDMGTGASTALEAQQGAAFTAGREQAINSLNLQSTLGQIGRDFQGARIERTSKINSVSKPSTTALLLNVAKVGLDAATTYQKLGGKF